VPKIDFDAWRTTPIAGEPYLSVIICTFNEEWRILPRVHAMASRLCQFGLPWELVIADNGSGDMTPDLIEDLEFVNVRVLEQPHEGRGAAVRAGMLAARGRYLLYAGSDDATPFEEVGAFLHMLEDGGYDMAVGCRTSARSTGRASSGVEWLIRRVLQIPVHDATCDFKMYRRDVARRLYRAQTLTGTSFDLEILHLATEWGYRVAEIPLDWRTDPSDDREPDLLDALRDMARIEFNDLRGRYRAAATR
jgi:dolichyl-phosphate beta-glucosyltransferase